jgi:hypothetical protein
VIIKEKAIIPLYSMNRLVLLMEARGLLCEIRTEFMHLIKINVSVRRAKLV